jgi:hypothetical protein
MQAAKRALQLAQARYDAATRPTSKCSRPSAPQRRHPRLVQNRQARLSSSVDLFKALGGGWKDSYALRRRPADGVPLDVPQGWPQNGPPMPCTSYPPSLRRRALRAWRVAVHPGPGSG